MCLINIEISAMIRAMITGIAMMLMTMALAGIAKGQKIFTFSVLSSLEVCMIYGIG